MFTGLNHEGHEESKTTKKSLSIQRLSTALFLAGYTAIIGGAELDQDLTAGRAFQVASIKRNLSESARRTVLDGPQPGGGWTLINGTILMVIAFAYVPGQAELLGLPSWVSSDRYDILAKSNGQATVAETRMMVRALLAERFGFRMHTETRRLRSYALEFARQDRSLGPSLRKIDVDCARLSEQLTSGAIDLADVEKASNGAPRCRIQTATTATPNGRVTTLKSGGAPLAPLLAAIGAAVGRPVVNKAGLEGYYEYTLEFLPSMPAASDVGGAPTIFTALREQLALKLVSEEQDLPVFVVDRIERPTED